MGDNVVEEGGGTSGEEDAAAEAGAIFIGVAEIVDDGVVDEVEGPAERVESAAVEVGGVAGEG
ncbi:MAG: hypothetical protein AAGC74_09645 [Verrucomicrobiota bacterium]